MIRGKGLLPPGFRFEIGPQEANPNRFPSKDVVGVKRSHSVFEFANQRRIELAR